MAELLIGAENEYSVLAGASAPRCPGQVAEVLGAAIRRLIPALPARCGNGLFLANGARFYEDVGHHPEWATSEVTDPWTLVAQVKAGERLLAEACREVGWTLQAHNTDYVRNSTWGSHESLQHRRSPRNLCGQCLPFLASRILYSGAGGLDPRQAGIDFMLSPRVTHLTCSISANSTSERGIYHTKDEPLAGDGSHRMHLICGEGLRCEAASVLRFGATALLVAMIDQGVDCEVVKLQDPLAAMQCFAADPECASSVCVVSGPPVTAMEIQRRYLALAQVNQHQPWMPNWAPRLCLHWERVLDCLAEGPEACIGLLDWPTKLMIFHRRCAARGVVWSSLEGWNIALNRLATATGVRGAFTRRESLTQRLNIPGPVRDEFDQLRDFAEGAGIDLARLNDVLALRSEICATDVRWSQLYPHGLFSDLENAGIVERLIAPETVDSAMQQAPPGRPAIRAKWIRILAADDGRGLCDWDCVWDVREGKCLNLQDPGAPEPEWSRDPERETVRRRPSSLTTTAEIWDLYRQGALSRAHELARLAMLGNPDQPDQLRRYLAWLRARLGFTDAVGMLDALYARRIPSLTVIGDYLQALRFNYLTPREEMRTWIERAQPILQQARGIHHDQAVVVLEYSAGYWSSRGQLARAREAFDDAYRRELDGSNDGRIVARILTGRAEVHRREHQFDDAGRLLERAFQIQRRESYLGDLAVNLSCQAKLRFESGNEGAVSLLSEARRLQARLGDRLGKVRTLLLEARVLRSSLRVSRRRGMLSRACLDIPALEVCPVFVQTRDGWETWTRGQTPDEYGDFFWGL